MARKDRSGWGDRFTSGIVDGIDKVTTLLVVRPMQNTIIRPLDYGFQKGNSVIAKAVNKHKQKKRR